MKKKLIRSFITIVGLLFITNIAHAQFPKLDSAWVTWEDDTLFLVKNKGGILYAQERANIISTRITKLSKQTTYNQDSLFIHQKGENFEIRHKDYLIMTVSTHEAELMNTTPHELAQMRLNVIQENLNSKISFSNVLGIFKKIGLTILVFLILFFLVKGINKLFTYGFDKIRVLGSDKLKGIKFRNYEFLSPEREFILIQRALNLIKWLLVIIIVYISLPVVFSIFPDTQGIAETLFGYIWRPLKGILSSFWHFVPNIMSIAVILIITQYVIRFLKFLSNEIYNEKLQIPGFYPDWAGPTFNIVKFLIYAFAIVIIFPYLPGSNSPVFQGVSVFLGLLISLGSSSAISNLIAGMVITYMRAFKIGDRVKIGDTLGDVIEKTALVTRVKTIKNETITIPNAAILTGHTINYSSGVVKESLILHTSVTIGYDVPWRKVHELLLESVNGIDEIMDKPAPFVLQTSLNDFYVTYEINAHIESPKKSSMIYSRIHENIQDNFNKSKIEILSPHYRVNRGDDTPFKGE